MEILSKEVYLEWCKINRVLEIESYEKTFALIFFIFRNSFIASCSLKNFSIFKNFFEIFKKIGTLCLPSFFSLVVESFNLSPKDEVGPPSGFLTLLFGLGIWNMFQKNWNLEKVQFSLFCWKRLLKNSQIFPFETKTFSMVEKFSQILFSNCPKVDIKNFQQQVLFLSNLKGFEGKFFLKNLNFLREISYKFLKSVWCMELGKYSIKIFLKFFDGCKSQWKPFHFFQTSLIHAIKTVQQKMIQLENKKSLRFIEKLIWINKKKKALTLNKKVKIRKLL